MSLRIIRNHSVDMQGHAQTKQRRLLLDIIREENRHVDAKELIRIAMMKDNSISPATVYRNLKLFKDLALIEEKRFGQSHCYYEPKHSPQHQHLVCSKCGKIVDFDCPLGAVISKVKSEKGFIVTMAEVYLEGHCAQCSSEDEGNEHSR